MSDSEDTAQLLGSKPSEFRNSLILNTNNVKPSDSIPNSNKSILFVFNGRKHTFEAFTPIQPYVGVSVSVLTGFCFGFDMTIGANLLQSLGGVLDLNCFEHRMLINGWIAGAILAALIGGFIMDFCGRRATMLGSSLLLALSSLLGVTSGSYLISFVPRFLSGCAVCCLMMTQCVYITETSRSERRCKTIVLQQISLQFGILFSAIVGMQNATNQSNQMFHLVTGMVCAFGISIFFLTYLFLSEPPHFILSQEVKVVQTETHHGVNSLVWAFLRTLILVIFVQLSGRSWLLYFAPRIFNLMGVCSSIVDGTVAMTSATMRIIAATALLTLVVRLGIKTCVMASFSVMAVSISFLSTIAAFDHLYSPLVTVGPRVCNILPIYTSIGMLPLAHANEPNYAMNDNIGGSLKPPFPLLPTPVALTQDVPASSENPWSCPWGDTDLTSGLSPALRILGVVMVLLYEAGYTLGFGSLGWLLVCETFPTPWRARGLALSVGIYFAIDLLIQNTFLKITISIYGLFVLFSVFTTIACALCYILLPITKGKSLTQIQKSENERLGEWMRKIVKFFGKDEYPVASQTHI